MTDLKSLLPEELEAFLCETGESAYRARQVFDWVHKKDVADFAQMTDLPLSLREKLARTAFVTAPALSAVVPKPIPPPWTLGQLMFSSIIPTLSALAARRAHSTYSSTEKPPMLAMIFLL